MAPVSFSPDASISSHTLSAGSAPPPPPPLPPAMDLPVAAQAPASTLLLLTSPLAFLQPTAQLSGAFLAAAKQILDPLAAGVSEAQTQRQQDLRRKRKRGAGYDGDGRVLHLKKVHLQGFSCNQVFEQTRKILDAATDEIERALPQDDDDDDDTLAIPAGEGASEHDMSEPEEGDESSDIGEEGVDWEYDGEDVSAGMTSDGEDLGEEHDEVDDMLDEDPDMPSDDVPATYRPDPSGLNDGFFEIDQFNKATDFLEQRDNQGEAADSDDEEIDWEADPYKTTIVNGVKGMPDDETDDEGGPTFSNVRLDAPEGDSDDDDGGMDAVDEDANANSIFYADFFAPPARKAGKNQKKRGRPNPHNFPLAADAQDDKSPEEDDIQNVISRVHGDLFSDEDGVESEAFSDLDPSDPMSRRSTHERRKAKLAEQIRKLEAANVAKRGWQLSGEVRGVDRPGQNSLLSEELEYERAGKPVPVITQEISEDIEALIKRRILGGDFDEVRRRRPDDLATGPRERRGLFELDDTKNAKGLAEIYEEEHLRSADPNFVDEKDAKLTKEHKEIEALWKSVSGKLDSLSSSNFKPKPTVTNLEIRVDAPAIEMEDARPTASGEIASASMLAPQELYKPGDDKEKVEVVTKSGLPVARDEMTREQKLRRRRREKERIKKAGLHVEEKKPAHLSAKEKKQKDKKQLIGDLKKGGVQVIGKKGVVTDVEGTEVKEGVRRGAGSYKL